MKLTILGTGNAMVTECYNTCFSISDGKEHFLVDAGGGNTILKQLKDAGIDWREIKHIFVTHKHVDHILGVMWLVRIICQNMSMNNYEGDAYIYSHKEVITIIRQMAGALLWEKHAAYLDKRLHLVEIEDGECKEILGKKVYFFDIQSDKDIQFGFTMFLNEKEKLDSVAKGKRCFVSGNGIDIKTKAETLINTEEFNCIVIKGRRIICAENCRGISLIMKLANMQFLK